MYIDAGEVVRVRVESDEFHDDEPGPPKAHEGVQQAREVRRPPYAITVCPLSPFLHSQFELLTRYSLLVLYVGAGARADIVVAECRR